MLRRMTIAHFMYRCAASSSREYNNNRLFWPEHKDHREGVRRKFIVSYSDVIVLEILTALPDN